MKNLHKTYPRDVLMNLLVIATLYASVTMFLQLVFAYINEALPDPLNLYYNPADAIRWPLSVIIIIFPVYILATRFLHRDLINHPEKNELRIRRWLVYFTVFAAGGLILGDLVALIYNFLQGELTWRFIFKVLAILLTAAAVFGYYLYILKKEPKEVYKNSKIFALIVIVFVLAAVVYGFYLAGSPFRQRLVRFDERKVGDLQVVQSYIVNYWMQKQKLPASLNDLRDSISGFVPPTDPQSRGAYGYRVLGDLSFELCANFNLESKESSVSMVNYVPLETPMTVKSLGGINENWAHRAGDFCFSRTIDPELYKPPTD